MAAGIELLLSKLEGVQRVRTKAGMRESFKALCPAHEDAHPSLEIDVAQDGNLLLLCRVCGKEATPRILERLALTWAEILRTGDALAPQQPATQKPRPKIVATYDYRDEAGVLLYQSCRVEPAPDGKKKSFFQRRPAGPDKWVNNIDGVSRVLYRLPELWAADPGALVWIPEGEGKVEALRQLGLVATCNVGGAKKWSADYNQALAGRNVVLLPDNDTPGQEHARLVAKALLPLSASVRILELPGLEAKGDIVDWLKAGGSAEQLMELLKAVACFGKPFPDPIPASLLRQNNPDGDWLWRGILARGSITLFSALWKAGKTTLLLYLLRALSRGGEFCGMTVRTSQVLYITEESESHWAERRDKVGIADNVHFAIRPFKTKPRMENWLDFLRFVRELTDRSKYDLVIFDTLSALWPVRDENDAAVVQEACMPLHLVSERAALQLVHHVRKGDGQEATAARGSGALPAFVDTIIELRRYDAVNRKDRRRVLTGYGRYSETPDEIVLELQDEEYVTHGDRQTMVKQDLSVILSGILPTLTPGISIDEIQDSWPGESCPTKKRLIDVLATGVDTGRWFRGGAGKRGSPYTYWRPSGDSVSVFPLYRGNTENGNQPAKPAGENGASPGNGDADKF